METGPVGGEWGTDIEGTKTPFQSPEHSLNFLATRPLTTLCILDQFQMNDFSLHL